MTFMHTILIYYNKNNRNNHFIITKLLSMIIIIINDYLHKSQTIINDHKIIKNPQRWCLLGRTSGGFCSFLFILFLLLFIYLHLPMFFILLVLYLHLISRLLYYVTGTPPWLLRPVKVSTSSELYPDYFRLPFLFHLPRVLPFWVGIFYPQAFFTLHSFPTFWHNLLYHGFTGSWQLLSWKFQGFILILETQTQPICLFDSQ